MLGQTGDPLVFHPRQKVWAVTLPVEHQGEAMAPRIGLQRPPYRQCC